MWYVRAAKSGGRMSLPAAAAAGIVASASDAWRASPGARRVCGEFGICMEGTLTMTTSQPAPRYRPEAFFSAPLTQADPEPCLPVFAMSWSASNRRSS